MAISTDLRKLIYDAVLEGTLRQTEIIRNYKISRSGLRSLIKHVEETGKIEPKPFAGGRKSKFNEKDVEKLKKYLDTHSDATLKEILDMSKKNASISAVHRILKKIGYHLKKNHYLPVNRNEKMLKPNGQNGVKR
jgi:transposase